MPTALLLLTALAGSPESIDQLFVSLPANLLDKAWNLTADNRRLALGDKATLVDRKNGYLQYGWDFQGVSYDVEAALFLFADGSPLVAVSYAKGDSALGLTSVAFYRRQAGTWVEAHPLPHLNESDFKIPKGNTGCPTCSLVYSFKLPRHGTVVEALAEYRTTPTPEEAGPGDTYEIHDMCSVGLKWDRSNGVFVPAALPAPEPVEACTPIGDNPKVRADAVCLISRGSGFYRFAVQAFGKPTGCEARDEGTANGPSSTFRCRFSDGSTYSVETSPPEVTVTKVTSTKPIADEEAVRRLLSKEGAKDIDWTNKGAERIDPQLGLTTRTYWSPEAGVNAGADLTYKDGKLVGFAFHAAL